MTLCLRGFEGCERRGGASVMGMEGRFKGIMGYQELWMADARLKEAAEEDVVDVRTGAA